MGGGEETRGVTEVTVRLAVQRRCTLSRASLGGQLMSVDTRIADGAGPDERFIDVIDERFLQFSPGATAEVREGDPDGDMEDLLEKPHRQWILRTFKRLEDGPSPEEEPAEKAPAEKAPPAYAVEPIPWWQPHAPFAEWSVGAIRAYREARKAWVWCVAAEQRRTRSRSDALRDQDFKDRIMEKAKRQEEAWLAERFSDMAARRKPRTGDAGGGGPPKPPPPGQG
jgi:hypothetical protein